MDKQLWKSLQQAVAEEIALLVPEVRKLPRATIMQWAALGRRRKVELLAESYTEAKRLAQAISAIYDSVPLPKGVDRADVGVFHAAFKQVKGEYDNGRN